MTTTTYRRNITKSRAGHYRLTLIDKATGIRVTDEFGWNDAAQARDRGEQRLAKRLAEFVDSPSVYCGENFKV